MRALPAVLFAVAITTAARSQALVPAGSINGATANGIDLVLSQDDPAAARFATLVRDKVFAKAKLVTGAVDDDALRGKSLVVYATPDHPLLRAHQKELPFVYDGDAVTVDGRRFTGAHLRLIAAIKNPADPTRTALVYTAAHASDLVNINSVFHGPTEWVVADGTKVLANGSFLAGVVLDPAAMRADLDELVATITEVHPSAVHGLPPVVAEAAAQARKAITGPLGRAAFGKLCASVLLALHDAHSASGLVRSGQTIALPFAWLEEGLVVTVDAGLLRAGDRIVSLAGRDAAALDVLLATAVPAENAHWRRHQAPGLLPDLGVLQLLGLPATPPIAARIERDGQEQDVQIAAGPVPQPPQAAERKEWVRYAIDAEHSLGVFTFDRCVVDDTYRKTLDKFFRAVHAQHVTRIAVDLRANSGGNSQVTDEFLHYLDRAEFRNFSGDVRWSRQALQQRHGDGEPRFEPATPQRATNERTSDPPPFAGELFVLIGPATFSSGNWFATVVQDNGFGKLVGEPSGNAPSSFGDVLTFTLPQSATAYSLSFKQWRRPDPSRDPATQLVPDVAVPRTRSTIHAGSDPVLDWLRALPQR